MGGDFSLFDNGNDDELPNNDEGAARNKNVLFYSNQMRSQPWLGHYIDEMLKWQTDFKKLENNHQYIQWLFPIPGSGGMNSSAQPLYEHEAKEIREDVTMRTRVLKAYRMMLHFYGMRLACDITGVVERNRENWKQRYKHLNSSAHNYRRITRIITSLGELGYERYQAPWVMFLMEEAIVRGELPNLAGACSRHWIDAIKDPQEREHMHKSYRELFRNPASISEEATPTPFAALTEAGSDVDGTEGAENSEPKSECESDYRVRDGVTKGNDEHNNDESAPMTDNNEGTATRLEGDFDSIIHKCDDSILEEDRAEGKEDGNENTKTCKTEVTYERCCKSEPMSSTCEHTEIKPVQQEVQSSPTTNVSDSSLDFSYTVNATIGDTGLVGELQSLDIKMKNVRLITCQVVQDKKMTCINNTVPKQSQSNDKAKSSDCFIQSDNQDSFASGTQCKINNWQIWVDSDTHVSKDLPNPTVDKKHHSYTNVGELYNIAKFKHTTMMSKGAMSTDPQLESLPPSDEGNSVLHDTTSCIEELPDTYGISTGSNIQSQLGQALFSDYDMCTSVDFGLACSTKF